MSVRRIVETDGRKAKVRSSSEVLWEVGATGVATSCPVAEIQVTTSGENTEGISCSRL